MSSGGEFRGITPYLHYKDVGAMIEWSVRVFGFEERNKEVSDGVVAEADLGVGEHRIWLNNAGSRTTLVWVDDVDAHYQRVTAAGVQADPPQDQDYHGKVRRYTVTDPEGNRWMFLQRIDAR